MKNRGLVPFIIILFIVLFVPLSSLQAQPTPPTPPTGTSDDLKTGTSDDQKSGTTPSSIKLSNPLPTSDVPTLIGLVIKGILGIVGSLALVMFIYGGFTWMLAGGNSEAVKKGRDIIVWAALGLVVIFTSYALVNFVITSLTSS